MYKLKSMYAERATDQLMFQDVGNGLELLETDFSLAFGMEIHAFLTKCHSIPAFLSNITIDLFNKRTFTG